MHGQVCQARPPSRRCVSPTVSTLKVGDWVDLIEDRWKSKPLHVAMRHMEDRISRDMSTGKYLASVMYIFGKIEVCICKIYS